MINLRHVLYAITICLLSYCVAYTVFDSIHTAGFEDGFATCRQLSSQVLTQ